MREIKFRQPIFQRFGEFKEFHYWGVFKDTGEWVNVGWATDSPGITATHDSQQYTGLKDKNGKEIYEGDLLRDKISGVVWVVKFGHCKKYAFVGWFVENETIGRTTQLYGDYDTDVNSSVEIIGNIYENPELLKQSA